MSRRQDLNCSTESPTLAKMDYWLTKITDNHSKKSAKTKNCKYWSYLRRWNCLEKTVTDRYILKKFSAFRKANASSYGLSFKTCIFRCKVPFKIEKMRMRMRILLINKSQVANEVKETKNRWINYCDICSNLLILAIWPFVLSLSNLEMNILNLVMLCTCPQILLTLMLLSSNKNLKLSANSTNIFPWEGLMIQDLEAHQMKFRKVVP